MRKEKYIKIFMSILVCGLFMGNEGCEEAKKRGRSPLKRNILVSGIRAHSIGIGDGQRFDLSGVLNAQLVQEVQDSGHFTLVNDLTPQAQAAESESIAASLGVHPKPLAVNDSAGACMKNAPDAVVAGNAIDFELSGGGGLSIGYGHDGNNIGVSFDVKKMSMEMAFDAFIPYSGRPMASASVRKTKKDMSFGLNLGFNGIGINPSLYFSTPMAQITRLALNNSLVELGDTMNELSEWKGRVVRNADTHIVISAGALNGIRRGDIFWVSNVDYVWEGKPCESRLIGDAPTSSIERPLALVQVENEPGDLTTYARIITEGALREEIKEGAKIYIYALVPERGKDPRPDLPNPIDRLN